MISPPDPSKPPITSEEQTFDSDDCRGQPTFEPGPWTKARELIRPVVQRHKIKFDHLVLGFLSQVLVFSCVNCPYIKFCTNVLAIASKILKFNVWQIQPYLPRKFEKKDNSNFKFQVLMKQKPLNKVICSVQYYYMRGSRNKSFSMDVPQPITGNFTV